MVSKEKIEKWKQLAALLPELLATRRMTDNFLHPLHNPEGGFQISGEGMTTIQFDLRRDAKG